MSEQAYPALITETNHIAGQQLFGRLHQSLPARAIEALDQSGLDLRFGAAANATALQLGCDHLGVVYDNLVAGLEPLRKICNNSIAQHVIRLHDQHASGIAGSCRPQRNAGGGKFEIEEISAHGAGALRGWSGWCQRPRPFVSCKLLARIALGMHLRSEPHYARPQTRLKDLTPRPAPSAP